MNSFNHYAYGAIGDSRQQSESPGAKASTQRLLNAGGTYRLAPVRNAALSLQYDLGSARNQAGDRLLSTTLTQSASASGDWRITPYLTNTASYQWRRTSLGSSVIAPQADQEGAVLLRLAAARGASMTAGGGVRTVRVLNRSEFQKYATAVASANGELRHGWSTNASASHTTLWDPERGAYGSETVAGSSRASFGRLAQLDASWQLSASGDSASELQRYSNNWSSRLQATPLRNLTVAVSLRSLRVGPALLRPNGMSRGAGLDVQWRPLPRFDLLGSYATNGALPNNQQRSTTRSLTAKLETSARLQFYGTYTRSDQATTTTTSIQPLRHESASGRVQFQPTRRVAASGTLTVSEPGREQEARQVDVAFTWSFGR